MTKLLSVEHAKNNILLHWKEAGFDIGKEPYAAQVAKEFGQDLTDVPVAALYVFVDEYLCSYDHNYKKNDHNLIKTCPRIHSCCNLQLDARECYVWQHQRDRYTK
ncbi:MULTISPECIES: hypothetical protein [Methylophaga]|uniref:hypothetical protein n=1 Tax=Methylophaga TaxID=40222 RepID=UPI001752BB7B|nr:MULTISPECIES: hypothetical protein [Methylophaga]HIC46201.1 hypothetical protein [Methylophaga sp.]